MKMNINVRNTKDKVILPDRVVEAFDYHNEIWKGMSKDSRNLMFMAIPFTKVHNQSLVLKEFANNHPTEFVQALANGYVSEMDEEIKQIRNWYRGALIRIQDGTDPDGFAKEAIEEVVHYLGKDEILADISRFNKNQMLYKKA